jgi:hypothetical protein
VGIAHPTASKEATLIRGAVTRSAIASHCVEAEWFKYAPYNLRNLSGTIAIPSCSNPHKSTEKFDLIDSHC